MRFLVQGEGIDGDPMTPPQAIGGLIEHMVIPSFQALAQWEREGKGTGGAYAGRRGGCMVLEAASPEALTEMLSSLPFWGIVRWSVIPLISYEEAARGQQAALDRIKLMGSGD